MRLLSIDQGNTRTKLGLFAEGALQRTWSFPTAKRASAAELAQAVGIADLPPRIHIGLCSVVPALRPAWEALAAHIDSPLTVITGASPTPLRNAYTTPESLGPDRLMAAVAAARVALPVMPLCLGTASVVDAVSAEGVYLGGMIAPGIGLVASALSASASALYPVPWGQPACAIGRSTDAALTSGQFYQALGGLQAMLHAVRAELGPAPLVLTGGWAAQIAPYLDEVALCDESLILRGIAFTLAELRDP